jgi:phosphoinositide-3-kinase regulatory subunit 4
MSGTKDGGAMIAASTGMNSVYVWDLESSTCKNFFRVISEDGVPQSLSHSVLPPPAPPALRPLALDTKPHQDFGAIDAKAMAKLNISDLTPEQNVIRALYSSPDANYVITGGADRKVRYWDVFNPGSSYVVSGIERNQLKPKYISHIEEGKIYMHNRFKMLTVC